MSNSTFSFTIASIERIKPANKQRWFTDRKQAGLQLCVTPSGRRTFYFYKKLNGKPKRERIGVFPAVSVDDARTEVRKKLRQIDTGELTSASSRVTLKQAFVNWLDNKARKKNKSWRESQRRFEYYLGSLHDRQLTGLRKSDITKLHNDIAEKHGKVTANRCVTLIKTVINFCIDDPDFDYDGINPCRRFVMFPEQSRERYLSSAELRRFFAGLSQEDELYRDLFMTALFTGARRRSVQAMQWTELDLDFAVWRISDSKSGAITIPLVPPVVELLQRRQETVKGRWVFPARRKPWQHVEDPRRSWHRILKRAEIDNLRIDDLRRTLGSWMGQAGTSELIIGKSLGHAPGSRATSIYSRLDLDSVRNSVEGTVVKMLAATEGNGDE